MSKFANAKYQNSVDPQGNVKTNATIFVPKGTNGALIIPCHAKNTDYMEIMEEVKSGRITIADAD
ncbi:MAG: hypothetical protein CMC15_14270 [Flavobacteriaceae bacterium]|nr:hypothetical protein [Flavobacteriaceae bacterium]|tara:strand:+ start:519 stop:713 length:195 start_codon:yes stop_codon:yes gene_type:complete